jgi:hypothetical protein
MPERIKTWESLIQAKYGCASLYLGSEEVEEKIPGLPNWKGTVQIFGLIKCGRATRAYLFQSGGAAKVETITVLGVPPVDSPGAAVRHGLAKASAVP